MTTLQLRRRLHGGCGEPLVSRVLEMLKQQRARQAPAGKRDDQAPAAQTQRKTDTEAHG